MPIKSIAIIPDGTRRWSQREQIELEAGYSMAFKVLLRTTNALLERGLEHIHLYMFSEFNLKRKASEIVSCLKVEHDFVNKLVANNTSLRVHGNYGLLSQYNPQFVNALQKLSNKPRQARIPAVHLYVCYSFANYVEELRSSGPIDAVFDHLIRERVDMVVRTGGARTLSDFLPTQLRYSQLVFLDDFFNDVDVKEYLRLCDDYDRREPGFNYGT